MVYACRKSVDLTNPTSYLDQYRIAIIRASIAEMTKDFKAEDFYLLEAERIATQHNLPDLLKKSFTRKVLTPHKRKLQGSSFVNDQSGFIE